MVEPPRENTIRDLHPQARKTQFAIYYDSRFYAFRQGKKRKQSVNSLAAPCMFKSSGNAPNLPLQAMGIARCEARPSPCTSTADSSHARGAVLSSLKKMDCTLSLMDSLKDFMKNMRFGRKNGVAFPGKSR